MVTTRLKEEQGVTTVSLLTGRVQQGSLLFRSFMNRVGSKRFRATAEEGFDAFTQLIEEQNAESQYPTSQKGEIPSERIEEELVKSLAEG